MIFWANFGAIFNPIELPPCRTHIALCAFVALIESGFAHPAKAEELTAAAMAVDVDALLNSCEAAKREDQEEEEGGGKQAEEEEIVMGVNTPPDTPGTG